MNFYFISKVKQVNQTQLFYFIYIYTKLLNFGLRDEGRNIYKVKSGSFFPFLKNKMESIFSSALSNQLIDSLQSRHSTHIFGHKALAQPILQASYHFLLRIN